MHSWLEGKIIDMKSDNWDGEERRKTITLPPPTNDNISKLRELTARLTDTVSFHSTSFSELETNFGKIMIMPLYSDNNIGIVRFQASAGSEHVIHYHPMNEIIGISSGRLIAYLEDNSPIEVKQYEIIQIPAGTPHRMKYPEATLGFAVTMPRDEGF